MTPSNVELLVQAFAGWSKDKPANIRDVLHPDCELVVPDSIPYGGTFRGADAVTGWFTRDLWRWFDEFTSTPDGVFPCRTQADESCRLYREITAVSGLNRDWPEHAGGVQRPLPYSLSRTRKSAGA